jgi:hypothetical protein
VYPLGTDGLAFFCEELQKSGPIPSSVIPRFGSLWSYLPKSAAERQTLLYLRQGGAFSAEQALEILHYVVKFILDFLLESSSHFLLCEDRFFAMSDPPNQLEQKVFEYAGVTYHYLSSTDAPLNSREIEEAIGSASSYPLILLLTKIPSGRKLPERAQVDGDIADELTRNVQHVVQGAFDEEGYIIWSRMPEASTLVF